MKTLLLTVILPVLLLAHSASAAELHLSSTDIPKEGTNIVIQVALDTKGESINALEGILSYPRDVLKLQEIRDGNSLVNFWVERPEDRSGIRFAGIIPGGYAGSDGEVLSLVFEVQKTADVKFVLDNAQALLNDGEGTQAPLTLRPGVERMSQAQSAQISPEPVSISDTTSSESFVPQVGFDPSLFEGRAFVAFATQDKGSGVDYFEVAESRVRYPKALQRFLSWQRAVSPHELSDQTRSSYIYVRAFDKAGNSHTEILSPENAPLYYNPLVLLAILGILLSLLLGRTYVRSRSKKS